MRIFFKKRKFNFLFSPSFVWHQIVLWQSLQLIIDVPFMIMGLLASVCAPWRVYFFYREFQGIWRAEQ